MIYRAQKSGLSLDGMSHHPFPLGPGGFSFFSLHVASRPYGQPERRHPSRLPRAEARTDESDPFSAFLLNDHAILLAVRPSEGINFLGRFQAWVVSEER
jgi:hypothetical protein